MPQYFRFYNYRLDKWNDLIDGVHLSLNALERLSDEERAELVWEVIECQDGWGQRDPVVAVGDYGTMFRFNGAPSDRLEYSDATLYLPAGTHRYKLDITGGKTVVCDLKGEEPPRDIGDNPAEIARLGRIGFNGETDLDPRTMVRVERFGYPL